MLSDNPGPACHPAAAGAAAAAAIPGAAAAAAIPGAAGAVPALVRASQAADADTGYVSPRMQLENRAPAPPGSPFQQPGQTQTQNQTQAQRYTSSYTSNFTQNHKPASQHGLNSPRPSLSPLSQYHSGFTDEDLDYPYPSSSSASASPFNLAQHHRRQHSFPNLLPLSFRSRTPSPTRKTHTRSPSEQMPYTGDRRASPRTPAGSPRTGTGGFVSWLSGSAGAASALGLSPLGGAPTSYDDAPDATPTRPRQATNPDPTTTTTPKTLTTASRFISALSSRFTPTTNPSTTTTTTTDPSTNDADPLLALNIESALFPSSSLSTTSPTSPHNERDTFSPSAFKNLHMNAAGLAARLQAALRAQATELRDLRAERAAQRDELDEAVTRAAHLKMQLEGMAARVAELEGEVERSKEKRRSGNNGGGSMVSEDLGVEEERRRRRRRRSGRRRSQGSEEEEDEEEDSDDEEEDGSEESESVFSRCRSPALPPLAPPPVRATAPLPDAVPGTPGTPVNNHAAAPRNPGSVNATPKQKTGLQMSAFQKIFKGIAGDETSGCENCKGRDASVAWDTVGLLRDENRHLKTRIGELEVAVEGALDLVNGIGM